MAIGESPPIIDLMPTENPESLFRNMRHELMPFVKSQITRRLCSRRPRNSRYYGWGETPAAERSPRPSESLSEQLLLFESRRGRGEGALIGRSRIVSTGESAPDRVSRGPDASSPVAGISISVVSRNAVVSRWPRGSRITLGPNKLRK